MTATDNTPNPNGAGTAKLLTSVTPHSTLPRPLLRPGKIPFSQPFSTLPKMMTNPCLVNAPQNQAPPICRHGKQYCYCLDCYFESVVYMPPPPTMFLYAPAPSSTFSPPPSQLLTVPSEKGLQIPALFPERNSPTPAVLFQRNPYIPAMSLEIDSHVPRYRCRHVLSIKRNPDYPTNRCGEQYSGPPVKVRKCGKNSKFTKCRTARRAIAGYTDLPSEDSRPVHPKARSSSTEKSSAAIGASTVNQDISKQKIRLQSPAQIPAEARNPRARKRVVKESPAATIRILFRCSSFDLEFRVYEVDIVFICLFFFLFSCFQEIGN